MKMKLFLAILSLLSLFSFTLNITNDEVKVVQIENLTPDYYRTYVLESLENNSIEITEACVPAKVLCVKLHNVSDEASESLVLDFFSTIPTSGEIKILENCTYEQFQTKCSNARIGR